MSYVEYGYLNRPYLHDPYLSGYIENQTFCQIEFRIDSTKNILSQTQQRIDDEHNVLEQIDRICAGSHEVLSQTQLVTAGVHSIREQIESRIDSSHDVKSQVELRVDSSHILREQISQQITTTHDVKSQTSRLINDFTYNKFTEVTRGKLMHVNCYGYLSDPYLSTVYLGNRTCVKLYSQIARTINSNKDVYEQIERRIDSAHSVKEQTQRRIDATKIVFSQIELARQHSVGEQITIALYNITNLRILADFPSRGTNGINWTATSTAVGDYSVNNLNTDIIEQIWKSGATTSATLTSDTGVAQGIFLDTFAMLNHNLTTSASVVLQGSNDAGFASIGFTETLVSREREIYYIAPTLPTLSFRYWRVIISDPTNTAGFLSIGTIIFGSAIIMQQTCIVDELTKDSKHFSDKVETEGFTNISNDRALKYAVSMEMRNLSYQRGDYQRIRAVFDTARTSLKCLWIPTPQFPERFAIFGKLTAIPPERHKVISEDADYVSFNVEVDESL